MIVIYSILAFVSGCLAGLLIAVRSYPKREVHKLHHVFSRKEGKQPGEWKHYRELFGDDAQVIVKPNCETLYSTSFVTLRASDFKLEVPPAREYLSVCFLNEHTDVVHCITNRELHPETATAFHLTSREHHKPGDLNTICLDVDLCWIIVRYGIPSYDRLQEVHELQKQMQLVRITP